jgi:Domain of unknown function (DUF222)
VSEGSPWSDRLPGPELGTALAGVDVAGVDDGELVDVLSAWRRQASWAQAGELAAVAELGRRRGSGSSREAEFASAEVGLALAISPRSADAHMDLAHTLAERLPLTRAALMEGRIDLVKARIIAHGTHTVDDDTARAVEDRVLPGAEGVTPGRLRARVERAVIALDPSGAERRRKACEADRRIECYDTGNGTAVFAGVHLPAGPAIAADNRVHAIANALKTDGDTRTPDQLSADVFLSLLLGTHPASGLPTTELTTALAQAALDSAARETALAGAAPDAASQATGLTGPSRDAASQPSRFAEVAADAARAGSPPVGTVSIDDSPGGRPAPAHASGSFPPPGDSLGEGPAPARGSATANAAAIAWGVGERIGTVHLTVPLATLLGFSSEPGEAAGYGPLTAEVARQMAMTASNPATRWCLTVTGADGRPLHHGHLAYRPPAAMAHAVRILQPTCRFPGCTRPSKDCDLDHRTPYEQGGVTCPCNLQPLCRRHHRTKGAKGWTVTQNNDGLFWTTPAGKTYLTRTEPPPAPARLPGRRSPVEARFQRCLLDLRRHRRPSASFLQYRMVAGARSLSGETPVERDGPFDVQWSTALSGGGFGVGEVT